MKALLEKIKQYRKEKKLSQEDMGFKMGMTRLSYSKIESGATKMTIDHLQQISKILKVSMYDLLYVPDDKEDIDSEIIRLQQRIIELMTIRNKKK